MPEISKTEAMEYAGLDDIPGLRLCLNELSTKWLKMASTCDDAPFLHAKADTLRLCANQLIDVVEIWNTRSAPEQKCNHTPDKSKHYCEKCGEFLGC